MGASQSALEGVAESLLDEVALDEPPVDAFEVAAMCGLRLRPHVTRESAQRADVIYFNPADPPRRQQAVVAHELGHWALRRSGEEDDEDAADYVSRAILAPRRALDRDLRRTWNPVELQARHLNAPAAWIAERIVHLRDAVATVIDEGKVTRRIVSPWIARPERFGRISAWERRLAERALEVGEAVQGDELIWAVPVIEPPWRRVVIVAEARQLSLRL